MKPNREKWNIEKLKADLSKFRLHFMQEATEWWEAFLEDPSKLESAYPEWLLPHLLKTRDEERPEVSQDVSRAEEELIRLVT